MLVAPSESEYALILHPADPGVRIEINYLHATLQSLGLGENPLSIANWYAVGPRLFEHITFLGCSPVIRFAAAQEGATNFCRLHLPPPCPRPVWRTARDATPPRCPSCRAADAAWRAALPAWEADPHASRRVCPRCHAAAPLHQWRLRETAGFGCSFVELWGIHPFEAVPDDTFLAALAQLSGGAWQWFYG